MTPHASFHTNYKNCSWLISILLVSGITKVSAATNNDIDWLKINRPSCCRTIKWRLWWWHFEKQPMEIIFLSNNVMKCRSAIPYYVRLSRCGAVTNLSVIDNTFTRLSLGCYSTYLRHLHTNWERLYVLSWRVNVKSGISIWSIPNGCRSVSIGDNINLSRYCLHFVLYTLGKKGCYTPIEDNKTNVDRTFVLPLGWNLHDMDPWLFHNEILHYLGQTFNARSSGIVELRNHSIGGRSPKSIFTLWQLWINICIFFKSFSDCSNNAPMGIRHEVFALAREGIKQGAIAARVGLTRATINRILKRHAATESLVPGKSSGAPRKTTPRQDRALLRMVRQDRFLSARALTAQMRNLYGMRAGRTTVNNRLLSRGYRAYRPTTKPLLTANHRRLRLEWAQRWRNLTVAHWQHVIFGNESRFQLYPVDGRLRVRRLPGERFRPGCQAHRVQAGGGSVHVWGAFHNSAKFPLVLPDGYLTGVLYRGILQNTLVPFARHYFGDNYSIFQNQGTPSCLGAASSCLVWPRLALPCHALSCLVLSCLGLNVTLFRPI